MAVLPRLCWPAPSSTWGGESVRTDAALRAGGQEGCMDLGPPPDTVSSVSGGGTVSGGVVVSGRGCVWGGHCVW